jgi:glycosyltransferase involved in cell wall biosynthesis
MYPTDAEPWFGSFVKDQIEALRRLSVVVHVHSFDGRRDWRAYISAIRTVRKLARTGNFDLIHAHYGLTGAVALCQRSLPVVTTFHGSDSGQIAWQRGVSWVVARRSSPIFVGIENARRLGFVDAPVVPSGVDTTLFRPRDRADARAALGWAPDHTYVLLPGARSNRVKGANLFDRVIDLVGRSVPNVRGVSLEGFSRQDVANIMNAVHVVLVTSDWEGSPVAVKEALACMTPVVSVPAGDVPSVLTGLPGCVIAPRDPRALADAVLTALQVRDPALRQRALEFSHDRIAALILEIYNRAESRSFSSAVNSTDSCS